MVIAYPIIGKFQPSEIPNYMPSNWDMIALYLVKDSANSKVSYFLARYLPVSGDFIITLVVWSVNNTASFEISFLIAYLQKKLGIETSINMVLDALDYNKQMFIGVTGDDVRIMKSKKVSVFFNEKNGLLAQGILYKKAVLNFANFKDEVLIIPYKNIV
jgi:hypothetical protein